MNDFVTTQFELRPISEVCEITLGQSPGGDTYNTEGDGPYFIQGPGAFGWQYPELERYCSNPKRMAKTGDVLLAVKPVGGVNLAQDEMCIGRGVTALRMKEGPNEYLYYFLKWFDQYWDKIGRGSVHKGITKKDIQTLEIPYPSLPIREKIVSQLATLDKKIEVNRAMSETLEDIAHVIYTSWFVDYEPFSSGERPENYQTVSTLGKFINGYAFSQDKVTDSGHPIIKIRELKNGVSDNSDYYPEKEDVDEKYHLSAGDILFSWSASLDVFLWKNNWGLLNQHIYNVHPSDGFSREFVYFSLKQALDHIENLADGTTMSHINRSDLDEVSVECLTPEMRERFTETVRPLLNEIIRLKQETESLAELRDYLLPQLLSGEVRLGGDDA